ncbi:MAG: isoleucyl-tRNA synthetase, partial [Actinomycetota bacterium]|nr:isoleucyl-tRNA synthetase [Actinomycetota bacterium]
EVKRALAEADGSEIHRRLEADGFVEVAGERLEAGDVEVRANRHEDFALATDDDWAVALDLALDEELELEGVARQLARDINDLRRARGLSLSDRIEVVVESADEYESITASAGAPRGAHEASPRLPAVLAAHGEWIAGQVLATSLSSGPASPDAATYPSDGGSVRVDLRVVAPPA